MIIDQSVIDIQLEKDAVLVGQLFDYDHNNITFGEVSRINEEVDQYDLIRSQIIEHNEKELNSKLDKIYLFMNPGRF